MFSRFVSNMSYIGSSARRYDTYKTDFYPKMTEISNIACRCVKTMPEIVNLGVYMLMTTLFSVLEIFHSAVKSKQMATK